MHISAQTPDPTSPHVEWNSLQDESFVSYMSISAGNALALSIMLGLSGYAAYKYLRRRITPLIEAINRKLDVHTLLLNGNILILDAHTLMLKNQKSELEKANTELGSLGATVNLLNRQTSQTPSDPDMPPDYESSQASNTTCDDTGKLAQHSEAKGLEDNDNKNQRKDSPVNQSRALDAILFNSPIAGNVEVIADEVDNRLGIGPGQDLEKSREPSQSQTLGGQHTPGNKSPISQHSSTQTPPQTHASFICNSCEECGTLNSSEHKTSLER